MLPGFHSLFSSQEALSCTAEGQTDGACLALLGKLFNAVTLTGTSVALVTFIRAPLVG